MPTDTFNPYRSENLNLTYIAPAQAMKHITVNEALRSLDALVQISVIDTQASDPPTNPSEGDRYIVAAMASGVWAGHDRELTAWQDGAWAFFKPQEGWTAWCESPRAMHVYTQGEWTVQGFQNLAGLGVGTTSDTQNRLAVKSPGTLLSHDGSDHQLKINKAAAADTASLLYQTNFSGRAEMGLTGDDDFHIKVSADGGAFNDAIAIENQHGRVALSVRAPDQAPVIADDSVAVLDVRGVNGGFLFLAAYAGATDDFWQGDAILFFDIGASPAIRIINAAAWIDVTTAAVTGTDGTDNHLTLSVFDGELTVENRRGSAYRISTWVMGG